MFFRPNSFPKSLYHHYLSTGTIADRPDRFINHSQTSILSYSVILKFLLLALATKSSNYNANGKLEKVLTRELLTNRDNLIDTDNPEISLAKNLPLNSAFFPSDIIKFLCFNAHAFGDGNHELKRNIWDGIKSKDFYSYIFDKYKNKEDKSIENESFYIFFTPQDLKAKKDFQEFMQIFKYKIEKCTSAYKKDNDEIRKHMAEKVNELSDGKIPANINYFDKNTDYEELDSVFLYHRFSSDWGAITKDWIHDENIPWMKRYPCLYQEYGEDLIKNLKEKESQENKKKINKIIDLLIKIPLTKEFKVSDKNIHKLRYFEIHTVDSLYKDNYNNEIISIPLLDDFKAMFIKPSYNIKSTLEDYDYNLRNAIKIYNDNFPEEKVSSLLERNEDIKVNIPKFKIRTNAELERCLNNLLFDIPESCSITELEAMREKINHVIKENSGLHIPLSGKIFVNLEVDEKGIRADQATVSADPRGDSPEKEITFDRPFILIVYKENKIILINSYEGPDEKIDAEYEIDKEIEGLVKEIME